MPQSAQVEFCRVADAFAERVLARLGTARSPLPPSPPQPLAYEQLFESERAFAQARKLARRTAGRIPGLSEFLEQDGEEP